MLTITSRLFIFFSLILIPLIGISQGTFKGGIQGGFTVTQIDGDQNAGFNKPGVTFGALISTDISKKSSVIMEMNYIQKGSRKRATKTDLSTWAIRLNYVEIPLLYRYNSNKLFYSAGLSYGRLINQKFIFLYQKNEDQFKKQELAFVLGASYKLSGNLLFETRYSRSLIPVRDKAYFVSWMGFLGGSYNSVLQFVFKYNFGKND